MFRVLLVDDEALARNDIKSLIDWEKHGFTIWGEAHNGPLALSMMEAQAPHIAILDVSMPSMNGVELSRIIKERFPKVKMIMLSSFDDYDYVRACLTNGAMDYLLKHRLNPAALLSLLGKAVQDLQDEAREHEARSAQSKIIERLSPVIHREYVSGLARDAQESGAALEAYAQENRLYPDSSYFGAAAVQIVPFLLLTDSLTDVQKNHFVQRASDVMQMAVGDIHMQTVAYVGEGRFIILFSSPERSEHAVTAHIHQLLTGLSHALDKFLNLKCVYAAGPLSRSMRQLGYSYNMANQHLAGHLQEGTGTSAQLESKLIEEQKLLLFYLEQLEEDRLNRGIAAVFEAVRSLAVHSMTVQVLVLEMLRMAELVWKRHFPHIPLNGQISLPNRNDLGRIGSIGELEQYVLEYYGRMVKAIKTQYPGGSYSRHVMKAVQFVTDNYGSDLSLETTARALNLNPSYLSRLFKEETQMTFTEYLNRVRIKTSCMLMEAGVLSLKQISSQVGFTNYTYYFKVFKNITGMTPQAYADRLKQSN